MSVEARAYCRSLDTAQTTANHDAKNRTTRSFESLLGDLGDV
jgi:hypothetical protein